MNALITTLYGLPRSGTESLSLALTQLGYKPFHGWDLLFDTAAHIQVWAQLAERKYGQGDPEHAPRRGGVVAQRAAGLRDGRRRALGPVGAASVQCGGVLAVAPFLGKEVPLEPFPQTNTGEGFRNRVEKRVGPWRRTALVNFALTVTSVGVLGNGGGVWGAEGGLGVMACCQGDSGIDWGAVVLVR
ncbi:hypothetical protein BO86DRAFT_394101 [Aspergillus japonicus CBS 114.51]|uniref:P-loop containing nucleoside triphosphate hydrolase protein n=1 Tax=Aspergillus japonicus CBS 114.51 TaxID=1448312 RepID=A0A8T8XHC4_ASPJA|nr:hypothetical protein BO86DRAFT_394101 [Aspergillus japonicus CBS 114.51]RAH87298.1 hypothetical protein BO86DRAFT_394101 [Aspergillus japonicus CBS 114.51]